MRRWHRWFAPVFGIFMLVIAATGVAIQITDLAGNFAPVSVQRAVTADKAPGAAPAPARKQASWNHWFKKIHSGEEFGPVGVAVSLASGVVLLFLAGSGLWMYWQMAQRRMRGRRAASKRNG